MRVKANPMTDDEIVERSLARERWMTEKDRVEQLKQSPLACLHALLVDLHGEDHTWQDTRDLWSSLAMIGADRLFHQAGPLEPNAVPAIVLSATGSWTGVVPTTPGK